jgi:hypothetical protein
MMRDYTEKQVASYCQLFGVKPPETPAELLGVTRLMEAHDRRLEDSMIIAENADYKPFPGY